jgi:hypothetical protein
MPQAAQKVAQDRKATGISKEAAKLDAELNQQIDERIEARIAKQKELDDAAEAKRKQDEVERRQAEADKPVVKAKALTMSRLGLAAELRNIWRVTVEMGVTPKQVMDEGFWQHVGALLKPGDEIQVLPDDYSWRLDLHVIAADRLYAHVHKLAFYDLTPTTALEKVPSIYKIEFAGAHHQWRVLREGQPLKDGFASRGLASRYAANHEAAVTR